MRISRVRFGLHARITLLLVAGLLALVALALLVQPGAARASSQGASETLSAGSGAVAAVNLPQTGSGVIRVTKEVDNTAGGSASPADFSFTISPDPLGVGSLTPSQSSPPSGPWKLNFTDLPVGATYTIEESGPSGYVLSLGSGGGSLIDGKIVVTLPQQIEASESVTAVNTYTLVSPPPPPPPAGSIIVEKVVVNPDPADPSRGFVFGPLGGSFTLSDGATRQFFLSPGVYTVNETDPGADWALVSVTSNDNNPSAQQANGISVTLEANEVITITFTNSFVIQPVAAEPIPSVSLQKLTNGQDSDEPPGGFILEGDPVTWTYIVTNTGEGTLTDVTIIDDNGTPANPDDDLKVAAGVTLEPGESAEFTWSGIAQPGQYVNKATVTANGGTPDGELVTAALATTVIVTSDSDWSAYFGVQGREEAVADEPIVDPPALEAPVSLPNTGSGGVIGSGLPAWLLLAISATTAMTVVIVARLDRMRRRDR